MIYILIDKITLEVKGIRTVKPVNLDENVLVVEKGYPAELINYLHPKFITVEKTPNGLNVILPAPAELITFYKKLILRNKNSSKYDYLIDAFLSRYKINQNLKLYVLKQMLIEEILIETEIEYLKLLKIINNLTKDKLAVLDRKLLKVIDKLELLVYIKSKGI